MTEQKNQAQRALGEGVDAKAAVLESNLRRLNFSIISTSVNLNYSLLTYGQRHVKSAQTATKSLLTTEKKKKTITEITLKPTH